MKFRVLAWRSGLLLLSLFAAAEVFAQEEKEKSEWSKWSANFALQTDMHLSTAPGVKGGRFMMGSYLNGQLRNKYLEFEARLEELNLPLPGRESEKGWGLPYFSAKGKYKGFELTLGDIYEQFGSGAVLRSYEDRNLGLDNSIRGARLAYTLNNMGTVKLLGGQHRNHFDRGWKVFNLSRGYVIGSDAELNLENIWPAMSEAGLYMNLGGSYVFKQEAMDDILRFQEGKAYRLIHPTGVNAWGTRLNISFKDLNINAEYAGKTYDPGVVNNYIFRNGSLAMITASYIWGGSSLFIGARRSEDFDFRADRSAPLNDLRVNFLQPFVKQQTYTLAALYPYATRPLGEWAFQGEYSYRFSRGSALGGRYGTSVKVYGAIVRDLKRNWDNPEWEEDNHATDMMGTHAYTSSFFGMGKHLFHDFGFEVSKRVTRDYSFVFTYMNQYYNQKMIEGYTINENEDVIHSNIFIYEGKHKLSKKVNLRMELQYMTSPNAYKDWLYGMLECSLAPHFVFSISDLWNVGTTKEHFYMAAVAGTFGRHRLQLSFGKTREGINCSGGVCRMMPATQGLYLSYNLSI